MVAFSFPCPATRKFDLTCGLPNLPDFQMDHRPNLQARPPKKKPVMTQNKFWDFMHRIEIPIVLLVQRLTFASRYGRFWMKASKLASSKLLSLAPCFLYCIGKQESARMFAKTVVCYALISTFGKAWIIRRRPGSYPGVACPQCAVTSAFPSRHSIGVTVIASFTPFKWPYIAFMVIDRLACGLHYLTDCIAGVLLGELAVFAASFFDNPNLLTVMVVIAFNVWTGGGKMLGGCLPVIMAPQVSVSWILFPIAFLQPLVEKRLYKWNKRSTPLRGMTDVLLATSLTLFVVVKGDLLLKMLKDRGLIGNVDAVPEWLKRIIG